MVIHHLGSEDDLLKCKGAEQDENVDETLTERLGSRKVHRFYLYVPGSINSHYFHIIGDGKLNPIVGVYLPIIRIPY